MYGCIEDDRDRQSASRRLLQYAALPPGWGDRTVCDVAASIED